jgi:hypothetical protein
MQEINAGLAKILLLPLQFGSVVTSRWPVFGGKFTFFPLGTEMGKCKRDLMNMSKCCPPETWG